MIDILKWLATAVCIIGAFVNAMGIFPLGPIVLLTGSIIWLSVSIIWKEPSLIVTNTAMIVAAVLGYIFS